MKTAAGAAILLFLAAPAAARDPVLAFPVDCRIGEDCFLQGYLDHDPGPGIMDYTCGRLTADGMGNTSIAVPGRIAVERGIAVTAVAPGKIAAIRDGAPDFAPPDIPDGTDPDTEAALRCGNAVVVDHGGGWESLYCHLRQGSVGVVAGQRVNATTELGQIGASGDTEAPQLALWILKDGAAVDPFHAEPQPDCDGPAERRLWQQALPYSPGGVVAAGLAGGALDYDTLRAGGSGGDALSPEAPVLMIWADLYGAEAGDEIEFSVTGPAGEILAETRTLPGLAMRSLEATGLGREDAPWPAGRYTGTVRLIRAGEEIGRAVTRADLSAD